MTDKLKQYIEENKNLLDTDIDLLIFYCDGEGLNRKELISVLEEAGVEIPETDVTSSDIITVLRKDARAVGGKITVSKTGELKYRWPDGDLVQTSTIEELLDIAKNTHLSLNILKDHPGVLMDYFD